MICSFLIALTSASHLV